MTALTPEERGIRDRLHGHVDTLARKIGGRSAAKPESLAATLAYIEGQLRSWGYTPQRQAYRSAEMSTSFENMEAALHGIGKSERIVIVGAHYDTAGGLPGANDNGSGVAATLELARALANRPQQRTLRWLFFANEEPPFFQGPLMGSYVYAARCHGSKEDVRAMLSLETIGYYSDTPGSQQYPIGFHPGYPDRGNFLGFVSNLRSAGLLRRVLKKFRESTSLPAQGSAAPAAIPGISWSDHWSFWQSGYKALMVTDTAPYRYPYYHSAEDTPDKLDYDRMARALTGLIAVVGDLASE